MSRTRLFQKTAGVLFCLSAILFCIWGCGGVSESSDDYHPDFLNKSGEEDSAYPAGLNLPRIIVETPVPGEIFPYEQKMVTVTGRVEEGDHVAKYFLVNDMLVSLEKDGSFNARISLPDDAEVFACINFNAVDVAGYSRKNRIAVLRGDKIDARELSVDSMGIMLEESLFQTIMEMINPVINQILFSDEIIDKVTDAISGVPLRMPIHNPVETELVLTINDLIMNNDRAIMIHRLEIPDPEVDDAARVLVEMGVQGIELNIGIGIGEAARTFTINLALNQETRALLDFRLTTLDLNRFGIKLIDLDVNVDDLEIQLPDLPIFNKNPIKIKNALAMLINSALSRLLDDLPEFAVPLPQDPINLGMIDDLLADLKIPVSENSPPIDVSTIINAAFSDMNIGFGIRFFGEENILGLGLGMTAFASDYPYVIDFSPEASLEEALKPSQNVDANFAFALSADCLNRVMSAFAGIHPVITLPGNELLSVITDKLRLPEQTTLKIYFSTPPVLDFREGQGRIFVPNLVVEIYMNSLEDDGLQAALAIDLIAELSADVVFRDTDYYLNFDFSLSTLDVSYLADQMGISRFLDMDELIDALMPQILDILRTIFNIPLRIGSAQVSETLSDLPINIPEFMVTLPELRMASGYLSMFIYLE